eukprot:s2192_g1.t2
MGTRLSYNPESTASVKMTGCGRSDEREEGTACTSRVVLLGAPRIQFKLGLGALAGAKGFQVPMDASPAAVSSKARASTSKWVDEFACAALCQLILDDRRIGSTSDVGAPLRRRRALPPFLYVEAISPFLRFDGLLPNMLYAFGGRNQEDGPLNTVEIFNTWHGCWVRGPPMPKRRAGSAAALLDDGRMMIIGGYNERGIAEGLLASCDIFDPLAGTWIEDGAAPLARARWGHGCASLQGKVYVVGGCSLQLDAPLQESFMETLRQCEIYLPKENRWIPTAPLQIARSGTRVVALGSRVLTAIGGCDDVFGRAETQPTVELYDIENQHWSVLEHKLIHPRRQRQLLHPAFFGDDGFSCLAVMGSCSELVKLRYSMVFLCCLHQRNLARCSIWLAHLAFAARGPLSCLKRESFVMALPFSLESKLDEFVDELVNQPPCLLGAFGKSKPHEKKSYDVIKLEDMESTPSTTTDEVVVSHEEVTPMCSSATSISDSPRTPWRDLLPMKVPIPTCWKETAAPSSSSPMHVNTNTGSKSPEVSTDATREHCVSSSLPALAAWAASEARAGRFTCLSTTPEVRPAPFSPTFSTPSWPVPPPFDAPTLPPGLERPVPPLPPPPQAAEVELAPRRRAGKAGQFLCRFVFIGFDATNHADFE